MIPEGVPFCHGSKIPVANESALAQTADFAVPPFDYHHGTNAGATTGGIPFHTFEGGVNGGALTSASSFLESQEAAPGRLGHCFRSAADTHLGEDRLAVRLHRPFCNKEGRRNLFIALSLCHQP
jgi:hypothetical protein